MRPSLFWEKIGIQLDFATLLLIMTDNISRKSLEQLIPVPVPLNNPLAPTPWPGITPESAKAVAELLRENHVKYHCFFNDDGFHK
jgi:hypothetical protein